MLRLVGASSAPDTADNQRLVEARNFDGTRYRTSFDARTHLLYADISLRNAGTEVCTRKTFVCGRSGSR